MILEAFVNQLQHVEAVQRLNAVIVLGTVDEVEALPAVVAAFKAETEVDVRQAMAWAGKRLQGVKQAGHSTLEAIFQHFRINLELAAQDEERERRLLEQMKFNAEMEHQQRQQEALTSSVATTIASTALFGFTGMMSGMSGAMPGSASFISSNMGDTGPKLGSNRIMPTRPTNADVRQYVRRLSEDTDPNKRAAAAHNLARVVNNPDALPDLAAAFIDDASPIVKDAAQQAAKEIYWNAVYWEMEQDGRIQAEIAKRSPALSAPQVSATELPKPAQPAPRDIASILKKAEAQRQKRKRF